MSHINDMNDMKREVKKTANKAKYMAKEVECRPQARWFSALSAVWGCSS